MAKQLLLVGGGHSHALVLRHWCRRLLAGVDLTLVSDVGQTPYSGMLPGHLAGFYPYAEGHIDRKMGCAYPAACCDWDKQPQKQKPALQFCNGTQKG